MTALSLVFPVQNFINAAGIGFGVGINAVIAFYSGAGDKERADRAATLGVLLAAIHGVILTVVSILIMPPFLGAFTNDQEVIQFGLQYSNVAFLFSVVINLGMAFEKIFQAVGSMKTSMVSLLCGCIVNIWLKWDIWDYSQALGQFFRANMPAILGDLVFCIIGGNIA